jgi:hypothetical protein
MDTNADCFIVYLLCGTKDEAGVGFLPSENILLIYLSGVVISVEVVQGLVVRVQVEVHVVVAILKLNILTNLG